MTNSPASLQAVFAALADPTRRDLLAQLSADGSGTATRLAADLPITRQAVSKHLATLAAAGLVAERRAGKERRYSLTPEPLEDATAWMAAIGARWDRRLAALERYLAEPEPAAEPEAATPRPEGQTYVSALARDHVVREATPDANKEGHR